MHLAEEEEEEEKSMTGRKRQRMKKRQRKKRRTSDGHTNVDAKTCPKVAWSCLLALLRKKDTYLSHCYL